ncbi:hypothetical protein ACN9MY_00280 [Pseudoduganella sp. R-31]|uniref:hypothetical protein n=1 Tax=unclassified Pseudoduganella TaxID=2637179 RepID=UPI003CEDFAC9
MEFRVFDDNSGAFVFTAPGSHETSDKFDRLVEAFEDGQIQQKRVTTICESIRYPVMHFWANEQPPLAKLYLGSRQDDGMPGAAIH